MVLSQAMSLRMTKSGPVFELRGEFVEEHY